MKLELTELRLKALGVDWREEEQKFGLRKYQDIGLGPEHVPKILDRVLSANMNTVPGHKQSWSLGTTFRPKPGDSENL